MNETVRLIVLVREPVIRLVSDYSQYLDKWATQQKPSRSLPDMVLNPDGTVRQESKLVKASLYHRHLRRWLDYFPRESLLVLDGDQLVVDPLPLLRRLERHLGLPPYVGPQHFFFNASKGFYCLAQSEASAAPHCLPASKGRKHPDVDPYLVHTLRRFFAPHNRKFYRMVRRNFSWPEN